MVMELKNAGGGGGGSGDVVGPASAVNNNIAVYDTTTGKLVKDGGATVAGVRDRSTHTGEEPITALDIDGGTDIGAALADADLMIVDDGAGGTNRKSALSRLWTYIASKRTGQALDMEDALLTRPKMLDYGETVNAIGSIGGGTQDIDIELGNIATGTVDTSTTTFTFSNPSASGTACSLTLILTNGGSQTVNWPASVIWAGGTAPELTASGVDVLTFTTVDAGTTWYGFIAGLDMS